MTIDNNCISENILHGCLVRCQLPKGHGGKHTFSFTWMDYQDDGKSDFMSVLNK